MSLGTAINLRSNCTKPVIKLSRPVMKSLQEVIGRTKWYRKKYCMPPNTYKGKRPAGSSSRFNTERFKDAECAERFESRFINRTVIFERIVVQSDLTHTGFLHWLHLNRLMILVNLIDECFEDWVWEFYCNIFDVTSSGFKAYVWEKTLSVDANKIATLLNLRRPAPRSYPFSDSDNIVIQANEVATVLCGEPTL